MFVILLTKQEKDGLLKVSCQIQNEVFLLKSH